MISKDFFRYRELVSDLPRNRTQGLSQVSPEPAGWGLAVPGGWLCLGRLCWLCTDCRRRLCLAVEENLLCLTNFSRF